jgi:uroporphyrinogen decarboxylase
MTSKERIALALDHKEADRLSIHDSPWSTTIERWHKEGLPAGVSPEEFFHFELAGIGADLTFRLPAETVEETDEYIIARDANGALSKNWKHATSTPERVDFTIITRELWEENKPRLAWSADRLDLEAARQAEARCRETGQWFYFSGAFGYDCIQGIFGSERLLMNMATEPEWMQEVFDTMADGLCIALEEAVGAGLHFDGCFVYDDMGYRNASLFSPAMFRKYEFPNHKKVYDCAKALGLKCILHSCGCVKALIPGLIEAGLACLNPLEVKAGMDLIELKQQYGEALSFMGGIDARKMSHPDPAVIEEEIRTKLSVAKVGGGYLYHSDHSIPDNVSFAQFQHVMDLVHKYGQY